MTYRKVALLSLVLMAAAPCMAQAPPAAPNAAPAPSSAAVSASAAPSSASASAELSPDLIKKARREGYKPEKQKNGETLFCVKDASLGTRFETKKCVKPDELQSVVDARQDQRNLLRQTGACSGANCSGK